MTKPLTIGLVVPFSTDKVPEEGPMMYPGVTFIPRAVGVRALTPEAQTHFKSLGMQPMTSTPVEAHEYIVKEAARWTEVIKGMGISVD